MEWSVGGSAERINLDLILAVRWTKGRGEGSYCMESSRAYLVTFSKLESTSYSGPPLPRINSTTELFLTGNRFCGIDARGPWKFKNSGSGSQWTNLTLSALLWAILCVLYCIICLSGPCLLAAIIVVSYTYIKLLALKIFKAWLWLCEEAGACPGQLTHGGLGGIPRLQAQLAQDVPAWEFNQWECGFSLSSQ